MIKISAVVIGVKSLEHSRSFYEHVLGITFTEFRPPFAAFVIDNIEFNLEENSLERDESWAKNYIGGRKGIGFAVDDLSSFLSKAAKHQAKIIKQPQVMSWGWMEAVIADSDGNEFLVEQKL